MPIYEYVCKKCEHKFEMLLGFTEKDDDLACPVCNSKKTERVFSTFASMSSQNSSSGHSCSPGG